MPPIYDFQVLTILPTWHLENLAIILQFSSVQFSSVPRPTGSSGGREGRLSWDPFLCGATTTSPSQRLGFFNCNPTVMLPRSPVMAIIIWEADRRYKMIQTGDFFSDLAPLEQNVMKMPDFKRVNGIPSALCVYFSRMLLSWVLWDVSCGWL